MFNFSKSPLRNYTEVAAKVHKFVPGMGHYKVEPKAYDSLSKSPMSLRKYRQ